MKTFSLKGLSLLAVLSCGFAPTAVHAQSFLGTWVRKADPSVGGGMNMTVEVCCSGGRRISYRIPGNDAFLMSIETHLSTGLTPHCSSEASRAEKPWRSNASTIDMQRPS